MAERARTERAAPRVRVAPPAGVVGAPHVARVTGVARVFLEAAVTTRAAGPATFWPWEVTVDADAVRFRAGGGQHLPPPAEMVRWADVERLTAARGGPLGPMLELKLRNTEPLLVWLRAHDDALLDALRTHAPPGVYRVSQADEVALLGGRTLARGAPRAPVTARSAAPTPVESGYRGAAGADPRARALTPFDVAQQFPAERSANWRLLRRALAVFVAALTGAVIVMARDLEAFPLVPLVCLGGMGAAALALRWSTVAAAPTTALRRLLEERGGPTARLDPRGMLVSADGSVRVRQLPDDLDDPHAGPHVHVETLDPATGQMLTTSSELCGDLGLPSSMAAFTERRVARVLGPRGPTPLRTSTTVGAADDDQAVRKTTTLVIDSGPDGAILRRLGRAELHLGDTFHLDAAAAAEQAEREFEVGQWRATPLDEPWGLHERPGDETAFEEDTGTPRARDGAAARRGGVS